jgi:hypothetical protein
MSVSNKHIYTGAAMNIFLAMYVFLLEPITAGVFNALAYGDRISPIIGWIILITMVIEIVGFDIKYKAIAQRHGSKLQDVDSLLLLWRWVLHAGMSMTMLIFAGIAFGFSFDGGNTQTLIGMIASFTIIIKELYILFRYFFSRPKGSVNPKGEFTADAILFLYAAVSYTMFWSVLVIGSTGSLIGNHIAITIMNTLLSGLLFWIGLSAIRLPYLIEEQFAPKKSHERLFARASTFILIVAAVYKLF